MPGLVQALFQRGHEVLACGAALDPEHVLVPGGSSPLDRVLAGEPDLVLAYDVLSPAAWIGARAARRLEVPLVLVEPASAVAGGLPWRLLHRIGERLWGRIVRQAASAVIAVDPLARERAIEEGFAEDAVVLLPQGIDLEFWKPGRTSALVARHGLGGRTLLYAGPLEVGRGTEVLLRAFARSVGRRLDWSLVFCGDGPDGRRLRTVADRLGVGHHVRFFPRAERSDLTGLFSAATLIAEPALGDDVRGLGLMRAMACGVPSVVSSTPRLNWLVEEDETGLVAEAGDVMAWADALQRAASSPEARKRWGKRAREVALERWNWSVVTAGVEQVLGRVTEAHHAA